MNTPFRVLFRPRTPGSFMRSISERYKEILFVTCGAAMFLTSRESHPSRITDTTDSSAVYDNINRRAYIRTGEDNYALVYPAVYRCATWSDLKRTILESINPLP